MKLRIGGAGKWPLFTWLLRIFFQRKKYCIISMKTSSLFIWHIIYFFTMDGFFRIFENTLSELICTRLYGWIRRQDSGEYSVRVPAGPCRLIFFKICPFSAEFHITGIYSIYKYLAKIMLLKENLPFMAEFFYSHQKLRKEQAKKRRLVTNDLNKSAAMETIEKKDWKKVSISDIVLERYF